ncbi:unnamed protein product, partial [Closterium sp. Naga37s-1]
PEPSAVPTLPLSPPHTNSDTSAAAHDTSATTSAPASHPAFLASEAARVALSKWCQVELMTDGADVTGRCHLPQYLLLARSLLLPPLFPLLFPSPFSTSPSLSSSSSSSSSSPSIKPSEAFSPSLLPPSWPWWAARVVVIHQRVLQERSPSLRALLLPCTVHLGETLGRKDAVKWAYFRKEEKEVEAEGGEKERGKEGEGEEEVCVRVAALVHLEAGMMEMVYAHVDTARCVCLTRGHCQVCACHVNTARCVPATWTLPGRPQSPAHAGSDKKRFPEERKWGGAMLQAFIPPPLHSHMLFPIFFPTLLPTGCTQVDPKAQLVLAVTRSESPKEGGGALLSDRASARDGTCGDGQGQQGEDGEKGEGGEAKAEEEGESMEELECLFEPESDVLLAPRLVEGGGGGGEIVANGGEKEEKQSAVNGGTRGVLRGVEQAAVLAMAVDTVKQNAADELRGEWDGLSGVGEEGWGWERRGLGGREGY